MRAAARATVLVVEDNPWTRELLELALAGEGYRVLVAEDGLEALERLDAERPALIVLDLMLPGMNGFELAEHLRLRGLRPEIPILLLSAAGRVHRAAAELRAEGCQEKPFDLAALLREVERLASGRPHPAQPAS